MNLDEPSYVLYSPLIEQYMPSDGVSRDGFSILCVEIFDQHQVNGVTHAEYTGQLDGCYFVPLEYINGGTGLDGIAPDHSKAIKV